MKRQLVAALLVLSAAFPTVASAAGTTVTFPFNDATLLVAKQSNGGAAYVPPELDKTRAAPIVVFLHGTNESQTMHPRMHDGDDDLRKIVAALVADKRVEPFVLAAPTHTNYAQYAEVLFPGFDLDAFLDATERAVSDSARIDRHRVIVVGHSGGGCNPTGGMLRVAKGASSVKPTAFIASDTCLGSYVSDVLREASRTATVHVYWQTWMWPRTFDVFRQSFCDGTRRCEEIKGPMTIDAHERVLDEALSRSLPLLLPGT